MKHDKIQDSPPDLADQKKKLLGRMGMALVLIALLLGGLSLFERGEERAQTIAPSQGRAPTQIARGPIEKAPADVGQIQPIAQALPPPDSTPPADAALPQPAVTGQTGSTAPPPPNLPKVTPPRGPLTSHGPKTHFPERQAPASGTAPATTPPASRARPAAATPAAAAPAPSSAIPPRIQAKVPTPSAPPPSAPASQKTYGLMVGGYMTPAEAEALKAKLAKAGIPATIQARVLAGPFGDEPEAGTARKKLEALGLSAQLILPQRR